MWLIYFVHYMSIYVIPYLLWFLTHKSTIIVAAVPARTLTHTGTYHQHAFKRCAINGFGSVLRFTLFCQEFLHLHCRLQVFFFCCSLSLRVRRVGIDCAARSEKRKSSIRQRREKKEILLSFQMIDWWRCHLSSFWQFSLAPARIRVCTWTHTLTRRNYSFIYH